MKLTRAQVDRYARHLTLDRIGLEGVKKIRQAAVLVVGAGGLGSPALFYLTGAGVGRLGVADSDRVSLSNLQRQVIHRTGDLGRPKTESVREAVLSLNPDVQLETHPALDESNAAAIVRRYDFIIDGTDNFPSKFLVNDACVFERKPFSHGGILQFEGQTMTILPGKACYRCVFRNPPPEGKVPSCAEAGVLGSVAGMLGTIQATEALKFISGADRLLTDRILYFDAWTMDFRLIPISKDDRCPLCGKSPSITQLGMTNASSMQRIKAPAGTEDPRK